MGGGPRASPARRDRAVSPTTIARTPCGKPVPGRRFRHGQGAANVGPQRRQLLDRRCHMGRHSERTAPRAVEGPCLSGLFSAEAAVHPWKFLPASAAPACNRARAAVCTARAMSGSTAPPIIVSRKVDRKSSCWKATTSATVNVASIASLSSGRTGCTRWLRPAACMAWLTTIDARALLGGGGDHLTAMPLGEAPRALGHPTVCGSPVHSSLPHVPVVEHELVPQALKVGRGPCHRCQRGQARVPVGERAVRVAAERQPQTCARHTGGSASSNRRDTVGKHERTTARTSVRPPCG